MILPIVAYKTNGQQQVYSYDVYGSRVRKTIWNGTQTFYLNDPAGKTEMVQKGVYSNVYTYNIWGPDNIGQVQRYSSSQSRYYYLKDHLGSVRMIVDVNGAAQVWNDYYPYGMTMPGRSRTSGSVDWRYQFTAKERDAAETGYDYFGARYYDSWAGRWLSVDPMGEKYPGWSPFAFCLGNPIAFLDPNGLWTDPVNKPQYRAFYYAGGGQYKWAPELSHFGENVRRGGKRAHQGVDLKAAAGTQTAAVMAETIVYAGNTGGDQGTKIVLKFKGDDGKVHYANYWHLSEINVKKGDLVSEGQIIAETGNTGNASDMKPLEEHLHFGIADVERPGLGVKHYEDPEGFMNIDDPSRIDKMSPKGFSWEETKKRKEEERKVQ